MEEVLGCSPFYCNLASWKPAPFLVLIDQGRLAGEDPEGGPFWGSKKDNFMKDPIVFLYLNI